VIAVIDKTKFYELFCFILTSARGCVDEPPIYGPLRLLDTYSRLIDALDEGIVDPFWQELKEQIDSYKNDAMYDAEGFVKAIDQTLAAVAQHIQEKGIDGEA
jgi:hypothetical protein